MKQKTIFMSLMALCLLLILSGCLVRKTPSLGEPGGRQIQTPETGVEVDETADWQVYTNEEYGYSFKYPQKCIYGPIPGECKQSPPEERGEECWCFLNSGGVDSVILEKFVGEKDNLSLAVFFVQSPNTEAFIVEEGTDLIEWLKEHFVYYENIPDEVNAEISGIEAVGIYSPQTSGVYSAQDFFLIKGNKLFHINMLNIDNVDNLELYNKVLPTFKFVE